LRPLDPEARASLKPLLESAEAAAGA
jgi:hypothetical protein